jgi:uncharacterized protein YoxC
MKAILFLAVCALLVAGCNNRADELEKENAVLQTSNQQLNQDLQTRDEYVNKLTTAINDVYASVEEVRVKEHKLLKESGAMENGTMAARDNSAASMVERIGALRTVLQENYDKLEKLQANLKTANKKYAGLEKMVASLKKTIEERDQSIAELSKRVEGLQHDVAAQTAVITQKDSVIDTQYRTITTTYYITGTRDELEKKGIIKKEGGFLWGLLGSTTTMASGFDEKLFKPLNKEVSTSISVDGKIDQILPARSEGSYSAAPVSANQTLLTIAEPDHFWKDKYLVIITDRESSRN